MVRRFLLVVVLLLISASPAQAAGWNVVAFNGESVSLVEVHPFDDRKVSAVANGRLMLSNNGGVNWTQSPIPLVARAVSYDPVYAGTIFAGTDSGVYVSRDDGKQWQLLEQVQTGKKITAALQATRDNVFAVMHSGAGTVSQVWRFERSGTAVNTNFTDTNASSFDYDFSKHHLYVGARNGVYFSDNGGAQWVKSGSGGGSFVGALTVKNNALWTVASDGLFQSVGGSNWKKLAAPAEINGTYYGNDVRLTGLAVSGGKAFYGAASIAFPYRFLVQYDGAARSVLASKVAGVATGGTRIWAATDTGLQVNDDLVTREARVSRPVIIIPGILGSLPTTESLRSYFKDMAEGEWDGKKTPLVLDPVRHTYDGLINHLVAQGYERDKTLFPFPYDWTKDNDRTGQVLAAKIAEVKRVCACSQVDLVGHSMGGLVARSYVQGSNYQGDVRNLIQVGAPNSGAVEAYDVWEGGKVSASGADGSLLNLFISIISNSSLDEERAAAVRSWMPSVGQLLPIWNYINSRPYPTGYPVNSFLTNLNARADLLKQHVAYYVLGSNSHPTPESLTVTAVSAETAWPHGKIISQTFGTGDGTVLGSSMEATGRTDIALKGDHSSIVTESAPHIARILMGGYVADKPVAYPQQRQYHAVYVRGNVAANLVTAAGEGEVNTSRITIPGAYTGNIFNSQLILTPNTQNKYHLRIKNTSSEAVVYSVGVGTTAAISDRNEAASTIQAGEELEVELDFGVTASKAITLPPPTELPTQTVSISTPSSMGAKIKPPNHPSSEFKSSPSVSLNEGYDPDYAPVLTARSTAKDHGGPATVSSQSSSNRLPVEILVTTLIFILIWRIGRMLA